jgi:hypothetical protein
VSDSCRTLFSSTIDLGHADIVELLRATGEVDVGQDNYSIVDNTIDEANLVMRWSYCPVNLATRQQLLGYHVMRRAEWGGHSWHGEISRRNDSALDLVTRKRVTGSNVDAGRIQIQMLWGTVKDGCC